MSSLILDQTELEQLTGYRQPSRQLAELHRQGFVRARRNRLGDVVLERGHFEAVQAAASPRFDYSTVIPTQDFNANAARRAVAIARRTPAWAYSAAIEAVYAEARRLTEETGVQHHVDHEIPLQGKLVSGLHVHNNLRALPARDNILKSNRFETDAC